MWFLVAVRTGTRHQNNKKKVHTVNGKIPISMCRMGSHDIELDQDG